MTSFHLAAKKSGRLNNERRRREKNGREIVPVSERRTAQQGDRLRTGVELTFRARATGCGTTSSAGPRPDPETRTSTGQMPQGTRTGKQKGKQTDRKLTARGQMQVREWQQCRTKRALSCLPITWYSQLRPSASSTCFGQQIRMQRIRHVQQQQR